MGKHVQDLTNGLMSFSKALPLLLGAAGGLVIAPSGGGEAPVNALVHGRANEAMKNAITNYTFYDYSNGTFNPGQGMGIKTFAVGLLIHKVLTWID